MKCPFCGTEMMQGYLYHQNHMLWSTKKHKISSFPNKKEEQYALYKSFWERLFKKPEPVESVCCPNCKRIIIDSTNYENNLGLETDEMKNNKIRFKEEGKSEMSIL